MDCYGRRYAEQIGADFAQASCASGCGRTVAKKSTPTLPFE
jgi:hypothetical protein